MRDLSSMTYREVAEGDLEAIASIYCRLWCEGDFDPADKMLAATNSVLMPLVRSPLSVVAELDGRLVGVCLGCVAQDGRAPIVPMWRSAYERVGAQVEERARTADERLVGLMLGDLDEFVKADEIMASGDPHAQAELNLLMVEPELVGAGVGSELFRRMGTLMREAGARRFFLLTDTLSNWSFYERRGMRRIWEDHDDPDDPAPWVALAYGGEL